MECYPAATIGNRILLSEEYFKNNTNDLGAIIHELTHVVQSYPNDSPARLREGIADYIRYSRGYQSATSYPHCNSPEYPFYDSGYWCSAAFLGYIDKKYGGKIIEHLNKALRENRYSDTLFATYTKKTIDELWKECLKKECKGGTSEKGIAVNSRMVMRKQSI